MEKGPCKRIEPIFKELAKSNSSINFLHIDIDEASETLPNVLGDISSVPTFYFFKDGKIVDRFTGGNPNLLKEKLEKLKDLESVNEKTKVIKIQKGAEFKEHISKGKVVVDFGATWCMPCKVIEPIFESLANENEDITFLKVDIDKMKEELEGVLKEINSVPTFHFYSNNVLTDMLSGANPILLKKKIEQLKSGDEVTATCPPYGDDTDSLEENKGGKKTPDEEAEENDDSKDSIPEAKKEKEND